MPQQPITWSGCHLDLGLFPLLPNPIQPAAVFATSIKKKKNKSSGSFLGADAQTAKRRRPGWSDWPGRSPRGPPDSRGSRVRTCLASCISNPALAFQFSAEAATSSIAVPSPAFARGRRRVDPASDLPRPATAVRKQSAEGESDLPDKFIGSTRPQRSTSQAFSPACEPRGELCFLVPLFLLLDEHQISVGASRSALDA